MSRLLKFAGEAFNEIMKMHGAPPIDKVPALEEFAGQVMSVLTEYEIRIEQLEKVNKLGAYRDDAK